MKKNTIIFAGMILAGNMLMGTIFATTRPDRVAPSEGNQARYSMQEIERCIRILACMKDDDKAKIYTSSNKPFWLVYEEALIRHINRRFRDFSRENACLSAQLAAYTCSLESEVGLYDAPRQATRTSLPSSVTSYAPLDNDGQLVSFGANNTAVTVGGFSTSWPLAEKLRAVKASVSSYKTRFVSACKSVFTRFFSRTIITK